MNALLDIGLQTTKLKRVSDIKIPDIFSRRMKTGIRRIDDLFDEGILPGGTFTITAQGMLRTGSLIRNSHWYGACRRASVAAVLTVTSTHTSLILGAIWWGNLMRFAA